MKKNIFVSLFILSLAFALISSLIFTPKVQGSDGSQKACVITIIVPNEHTRYECKERGRACGNPLDCMPTEEQSDI